MIRRATAKAKTVRAYPEATPSNFGSNTDLFTRGDYDGAELKPNPGIPPERFNAFKLPSLIGGVRVYPRSKP
jgi:hypothetical protein